MKIVGNLDKLFDKCNGYVCARIDASATDSAKLQLVLLILIIIYNHLKVQLQLVGAPQLAPQVPGTYAATLHYQMTYCVHNHSFYLKLPRDTDEAQQISSFMLFFDEHSAICLLLWV